jgi:hypothetical protein
MMLDETPFKWDTQYDRLLTAPLCEITGTRTHKFIRQGADGWTEGLRTTYVLNVWGDVTEGVDSTTLTFDSAAELRAVELALIVRRDRLVASQ